MEHLANTTRGSPSVELKKDDVVRTLDQLQQALYPEQDATAQEQVSQSMGDKHVVLLRRALLLVKTAKLFAEDDSKPAFGQGLWNAIKQTAGSMLDHSKAQSMPEHTEQHTPAEGAEAERLALLLVAIILPFLRQSLAACNHVPEPSHSQTNHNGSAHSHGALPCTTGILCDLLVSVLMTSSQCAAEHRIAQLCAVRVVELGESPYCCGPLFWPNTHVTDAQGNQCIALHLMLSIQGMSCGASVIA